MEGDSDADTIFSEGRQVEVRSDEEGFKGAWFNATILKLPKKKTTKEKEALIQYKDLFEGDGGKPLTEHAKLSFIRPLPPQSKVPEDQCFQVNDVVDAFHFDGWWTGIVSKVSDNPKMYFVSFPNPLEEIEFPSGKLRPHWKWVDGKWVKPSTIEDALVSSDCEKLMVLSCSTTDDAEATIQLESSYSERRTKKKHEPCGISSIKDTGLSTASKRTTKGKLIKRGTPDATRLHPSKKLKDGSLSESLVLQESTMKVLPSETPNKEVPTAADFTGNNLVGEQPVVKTKKVCVRDEVEINLPKEHGRDKNQTQHGAMTNKREQPRVVLEIEQPKLMLQISKSPFAGQNYASGVLEEKLSEEYTATEVGSPEMERAVVVSATDCQTKEIEVIGKSGGLPCESKEQSSLVCCKELQSSFREIPSLVMEENNLVASGFANQTNDAREISRQIMVHSELQEGENLPFVKSLPIWKAVDTMEIFQAMPQNPHFQPLLKFNEILREGIAVGHMMNFASLVQRISMLKISDPRNVFTTILDALIDLEMLGFDVKAVSGRTSELLFMRDRYGHLQDQSKEDEVQITQLSDELTKVGEEIDVIKKTVTELEEKQALLMSKKESYLTKIATLQECADAATQDIQSVEDDFESLALIPW